MNATNVLEEKIVLFIDSAKIPEREESISQSSFYQQLPRLTKKEYDGNEDLSF